MWGFISKLDDWFIEGWRRCWRLWSVWMMAIGGVIGTVMSLMPSLPPEVQAVLPVKYRVIIVAVWSIASILTRFIKQKKLNA